MSLDGLGRLGYTGSLLSVFVLVSWKKATHETGKATHETSHAKMGTLRILAARGTADRCGGNLGVGCEPFGGAS